MSILTRTLLNEGNGQRVYELQFQVSEIYNRCALKVSEAYRATTFLYHAIDVYSQEDFIPMLIDSLPISYLDPIEGDKIAKHNVLQWVYRNCFSNFMAGATESLVSSILLLNIQKLALDSSIEIYSKADLDEKLDKLEISCRQLPVPALFKKVEEGLGREPLLKREIQSINRIRNCIVHDDALVAQKHINGENHNLELYFVEKVARIEVNKEWILMTKEVKEKATLANGLKLQDTHKSMSFPLGSRIDLNPELINSIAYTCNKFSEHLFSQFL